MDIIASFLETLVGILWGPATALLLLGVGIYFSIGLKGIQFKGFRHALKIVGGKYDNSNDPGEISHFQALTTALSATVGLGNIAGVAIAIQTGGPGATFWMILTGLIGMATKYTECTLSVHYRNIDKDGTIHGGPMYYIIKGLGPSWKPLSMFFCFALICGTFGAANMFQTNQVAEIVNENFGISKTIVGLTLAILTGGVILGGIKRIGSVTSKLVPLMGGIYFIGAIIVICFHITEVPSMFALIFTEALNPQAATGGFFGGLIAVFLNGVRRASFSNEAGLGTAPIAHSAAKTKEPVREGHVALLEPFIDTIVICTLTALVILLSGAHTQEGLTGVRLTATAFNSAIPGFGEYFVPIAVFLFAYSTLLSWAYYGEQGVHYLFKGKGSLAYKIIYCIVAFIGAIWSTGPVLNFSDSMLALMIIPNLIALIILFPKVKKMTMEYMKKYY